MATKIITVEATPPAESTGADYYKGAPLNAAEFDQNLVNLRAAVDRKASLSNPTFTGTVTLPSTTSIGDVSATELQYLNSVTSNVQDQINSKAPINNPTFTGTVSLPGGTANGVLYLNGSKVATSGSALTFDGSTLGLGTTPKTWASSQKALQIGAAASIFSSGSVNTIHIGANVYYDGAYKYISTGEATRYYQASGSHYWYSASSGSADSAITFTQAMTLDSSGNLGIGTSSPSQTATGRTVLSVNGATTALINLNIATIPKSYWYYDGTDTQIVTASGGTIQKITTGNAYTWQIDSEERMRLDSSGNLGIGTASPSSYGKLTCYGGDIVCTDGTIKNMLSVSTSSPAGGATGTTSNHPLKFYTNSTANMTLDTSGNLGLGVTPSAWFANSKVFQFGAGGSLEGRDNNTLSAFASNSYIDTSGNYRYITTNFATRYYHTNGQHIWQTSPSGTAGNAISFTQAMTLDSSGNLLVGTTSKVGTERFNATGDTNDIVARIKNANANPSGLEISFSTAAPNNTSNRFLSCWDSTTSCFTVWSNGTTSGRSDAKLKKNITDASPKLDDVCQLKVRNYEWIDSIDGSKEIGFIAQEMEEVFPSLIIDQPDYEEITKTKTVEVPAVLDEEGNEVEPATTKEEEYTERVATGTTTKQIKHSVLVPILVKAIQEQQAIIESLTQRIEALEYTKQGE